MSSPYIESIELDHLIRDCAAYSIVEESCPSGLVRYSQKGWRNVESVSIKVNVVNSPTYPAPWARSISAT